jgi:hypothetical protein
MTNRGTSSSISMTEKSIQAERFIPQHKRLQWDSMIPSMILIASPLAALRTTTTSNTSAVLQWVYHTEKKRSTLDTCTFNILHYIDNCANYLNHCCLNQKSCGVIAMSHVLPRYSDLIGRIYHQIQQQIVHVKLLESRFNDLSCGFENDKDEYCIERNCVNPKYTMTNHPSPQKEEEEEVQDRILQTTPEKLARICDEIEFVMETSWLTTRTANHAKEKDGEEEEEEEEEEKGNHLWI